MCMAIRALIRSRHIIRFAYHFGNFGQHRVQFSAFALLQFLYPLEILLVVSYVLFTQRDCSAEFQIFLKHATASRFRFAYLRLKVPHLLGVVGAFMPQSVHLSAQVTNRFDLTEIHVAEGNAVVLHSMRRLLLTCTDYGLPCC